MSSLLVFGPNPRRRRSKRKGSRRGRRKMTAKQLQYFGGGKRRRSSRKRSASRRRPRSVSAVPMLSTLRRSRRSRRRSRRSGFRRNPISTGQIRASLGSVTRMAANAFTGAAGAVVSDIAMGQAARFLPATLMSRLSMSGGPNWGYYATKAGLTIALGILGTRFAPGRMKGIVAKGTEGALTVQAYEVARTVIPADLIALGYYNPARITGGNGLARVGRMAAYQRTRGNMSRLAASYPGGGSSIGIPMHETRIGEGAVS